MEPMTERGEASTNQTLLGLRVPRFALEWGRWDGAGVIVVQP